MSLSRKNVNELAMAGWTVVNAGPWPALRTVVRALVGRAVLPARWSR